MEDLLSKARELFKAKYFSADIRDTEKLNQIFKDKKFDLVTMFQFILLLTI